MRFVENQLQIEDVNALRESVGWKAFSVQQAEQAIAKTCFSVVCYDHEFPVAMGRMVGDGIYYMLVDIITHPTYQHRGIGKQIVRQLLNKAANALSENERCSVALIAAADKVSFYEMFGFDTLLEVKSGYGMKLTLPQ